MFFDQQLSCPNLAIPEYVMRHIVNVESGDNPFAIGVVGGRLERQPKTLEEAVATATMLESKGYNFSLGIAQINRYNLAKFGLTPYEKAFDPCANLKAGAKILADCYTSAKGEWDKAFSCYYSGNFVTGLETGYVQKIYDSMRRESATAVSYSIPNAIPLTAAVQTSQDVSRQAKVVTSNNSRVAMRSTPLGEAQPATVSAALPASPEPLASQLPAAPAAASGPFMAQVRRTADTDTQAAVVQVMPTAAPAGNPQPKVPDSPDVDQAFVF